MVMRSLKPQWTIGNFGYLISTDGSCIRQPPGKIQVHETIDTSTGFAFVPFKGGTVFCQPNLLLPLENRTFEYFYNYSIKYPLNINRTHLPYIVNSWKSKKDLDELIKITESQKFSFEKWTELHWFWATVVIICGVFLLIIGLVIFCWLRWRCIKAAKSQQTTLHRRNAIRRRTNSDNDSDRHVTIDDTRSTRTEPTVYYAPLSSQRTGDTRLTF
jgi:hypothetical protein